MAIDSQRLDALVGQLVGDYGATISSALVVIGDRLGLYETLASGERTPAELAAQTATSERFAADWLVNQAASGYVTHDPERGTFRLSPEQALLFADPNGPLSAAGGFQVITAAVRSLDRVEAELRNGGRVPWGEHHPDLFEGTRRFFEPGYVQNLVSAWLPALDGVVEKLQAGAAVADVGCGFGASTLLMARAFPTSTFTGFDNHPPSIEAARASALAQGVPENVRFDVADASSYPGTYDLVAFFDCFHDMGHLDEVARHVADALNPGGSLMLVEPMAGRTTADNLNPVGRIYAGASVLICSPNAMALGGPAIGTIATDDAIGSILLRNGFSQFRRATETPFNRVFEARR